MCFMVKAQGNTGPEMDLLSCIHSEGSASGLFHTMNANTFPVAAWRCV